MEAQAVAAAAPAAAAAAAAKIEQAPGSAAANECSSMHLCVDNAAAAAAPAPAAAPDVAAAAAAPASNQDLNHVVIEIQSTSVKSGGNLHVEQQQQERSSSNRSEDEDEDDKVCRVCHLSLSKSSSNDSTQQQQQGSEAIRLGCDCKDDLAIAHKRCAETWFKIKGNRTCEICGQVAQNISACFADDFACARGSDDRSDSIFASDATAAATASAESARSFWHHRPICNFVLAFIVVILLLPWLFRIRLF